VVGLNEHGGHGGSDAAPAAAKVIAKYFELRKSDGVAFGPGWTPPVKPPPALSPATPARPAPPPRPEAPPPPPVSEPAFSILPIPDGGSPLAGEPSQEPGSP
jgi:penicillin-binding protein 2